jgi:dephospho-CoA kinase
VSDFVVGLTGGIGSGKTAVSDYFKTLGITVVDADEASRIVVEPSKPALEDIRQHFGNSVIQSDGTLDRAALRTRIFEDSAERQWLEQLLHPLINQQIQDELKASTSPYAILVSPLLVETGQSRFTQRTLIVDVEVDRQIERTMTRDNNSEEQVRNIINAQTSREERLAIADDVILNDQSLDALYAKVDELHEKYLQLAKNR